MDYFFCLQSLSVGLYVQDYRSLHHYMWLFFRQIFRIGTARYAEGL